MIIILIPAQRAILATIHRPLEMSGGEQQRVAVARGTGGWCGKSGEAESPGRTWPACCLLGPLVL
ncbi:MAG: hypothetical protein IMY75_02665 [Chloroflexi bacterium]|nr:hypothetical protein [Chloroflexota bacterium]